MVGHLFHIENVQAMQPTPDYERRKAFREWLLQRDATSPSFPSRMLLMDEASFILLRVWGA
jgi:hypothetical protein